MVEKGDRIPSGLLRTPRCSICARAALLIGVRLCFEFHCSPRHTQRDSNKGARQTPKSRSSAAGQTKSTWACWARFGWLKPLLQLSLPYRTHGAIPKSKGQERVHCTHFAQHILHVSTKDFFSPRLLNLTRRLLSTRPMASGSSREKPPATTLLF